MRRRQGGTSCGCATAQGNSTWRLRSRTGQQHLAATYARATCKCAQQAGADTQCAQARGQRVQSHGSTKPPTCPAKMPRRGLPAKQASTRRSDERKWGKKNEESCWPASGR